RNGAKRFCETRVLNLLYASLTIPPVYLSLSRFNRRLAACAGPPDMIKDAAACHLRLQCDLKGWDKVLHLVHGHIRDLQERERDCRPGNSPPPIAGTYVPGRHREQ